MLLIKKLTPIAIFNIVAKLAVKMHTRLIDNGHFVYTIGLIINYSS